LDAAAEDAGEQAAPWLMSPLAIGHAVETDATGLRMDVVHVFALLWIVGFAGVGSPGPGVCGRHAGIRMHRVARNPPQEVDLAVLGVAQILLAVDEEARVFG
jgi:hypothetical protein